MLFEREIEIINIMWRVGRPLAAIEIVAESNGIPQSTVQTILRKLLKEGLIEIVGTTHSGNALSRTYCPSLKTREMMRKQMMNKIRNATYIIGEDTVKDIEKILMK